MPEYTNIIPLQAVARSSPLVNQEAKVLFSIWQGDMDRYGNFRVPNEADPLIVASLVTKGYLRSGHGVSLANPFMRLVGMTDKGKAVVRDIILHTEQSAFKKQSSDFNYENLYHRIQHKNQKIASKITILSTWLFKMRGL